MTVAGWIITGLAFALVATLGIGATALNMERKRHEREENKIRQEGGGKCTAHGGHHHRSGENQE